MEFTALELALGGAAISFLTGVATRMFFSNHYVTRREFETFELKLEQRDKEACERSKRFDRKFDVLFRMNRATIQFLPITDKDKEEILNMTDGHR